MNCLNRTYEERYECYAEYERAYFCALSHETSRPILQS